MPNQFLSKDEVALLVASWNAHNRIGTAVRVLLDDGSSWKTKTASEAWYDSGGQPVVKVEGFGGGYRLFRVAVDWID